MKKLLQRFRPRLECPCETLGPVDDETWAKLVHHVPNRATRRALRRSDAGKGITHYDSVDALFKHLNSH